ncbi:uncharacterized protein Smp_204100 [Schistosoma mansoni]|uniref:uncharacterized protein n=1 Tax=Schistosoma mansoni TaxID=6183 RepID=UPI00022DC980|nr:uncharacterized protein Smp_204100 [Schistosoma mansoni]|eukprot:XP_018654386.1 uncharacterized protein Smp_204100 [Schistosoma mansoni]
MIVTRYIFLLINHSLFCSVYFKPSAIFSMRIFILFYFYLIIISKSIHCKIKAILSTSISVCYLKDS